MSFHSYPCTPYDGSTPATDADAAGAPAPGQSAASHHPLRGEPPPIPPAASPNSPASAAGSSGRNAQTTPWGPGRRAACTAMHPSFEFGAR